MALPFVYKCNAFECRKELHDDAVVTTCNHIYCLNCADSRGLTSGNRICPACGNELLNADDLVMTTMRPNAAYKASVLSGLTPADILECASSGIEFFRYQTNQDILYETYKSEHTQEVNHAMEAELRQRRSQFQALQDEFKQKLTREINRNEKLQGEIDKLRAEIAQKDRQHHRTQADLNGLKQVTEMNPRLAQAAAAEVGADFEGMRSHRQPVRSGPPFVDERRRTGQSRSSGEARPGSLYPGGALRQDHYTSVDRAPPGYIRMGQRTNPSTVAQTPQRPTRMPIHPTPQHGRPTNGAIPPNDRHIPNAYGLAAGAKASRHSQFSGGTPRHMRESYLATTGRY